MADSSRHSTRLAHSAVSLSQLLPTDPHSAIICGQTGCGKTVFVLDLLEGPYRGVFRHIVILCPTARHNKTYQERSWIWKDPEIFIVDPGERLHDYLRALYQCFEGEPTLYLIDDCAATKALTKKKDMLSELAFSGRHAGASVWVLTQKFNAVGKDLREQTKWVALFHCKDRDSFEDCLRENDVIPTTVFVLDLLEGPYRGVFRHIVILCPTARHNKTYQERSWIWKDPEIFIVDPGERLHDYLCALYQCFEGEPTLYLIDDCAATKALTKKKDMLSELAFSGRHAGASVWVLTQKFNAVGKDLREQTKWVALFHCKDRDSFEDCLRENDVIPTREERAAVRQLLAETKHAKLVLKTDQPAAYQVLCWA